MYPDFLIESGYNYAMNSGSNDNLSLHDALTSYANLDVLPMHMPGHKRNLELVDDSFRADITEIDGFDNLHCPEGLIKQLATDSARLWGAKKAFLSVNGASGLILSAIAYASSFSSCIAVARNSHISVWNAIEVSGLDFEIINPEFSRNISICFSIDASQVEATLRRNPSIKAVVVTSPTYEGVASNVAEIVETAHRYGAIVILDQSHGAHFGLDSNFLPTDKADIVIKSVHKTLACPTQTALMLTYGDTISETLLSHYIDVFETTSPSYVLLSGLSRCIESFCSKSNSLEPWVSALISCRKSLSSLNNLSLLYSRDDEQGLFSYDISKLVILTNECISGFDLMSLLRSKFNIEVEAAFPNYIIAMTGQGDTMISLKRFSDALLEIDASLSCTHDKCKEIVSNSFFEFPECKQAMRIQDAVRSNSKVVDFNDSCECVSRESLYVYPPGIPLILPGQVINIEVIKQLVLLERTGVIFKSSFGYCTNHSISVVDDISSLDIR